MSSKKVTSEQLDKRMSLLYDNYNNWYKLESFEGEKWRQILGYENRYEISSFGRVKSYGGIKNIKPKILKYSMDEDGCLFVTLCGPNNIHKTIGVHRLVGLIFLQNPLNYPQINHKNSNPSVNLVDNLEWGNQSQNIKYAIKYGKFQPHLTKICKDKEKRIKVARKDESEIGEFDCAAVAAKSLDINVMTIYKAATKGHLVKKSYYFEYV